MSQHFGVDQSQIDNEPISRHWLLEVLTPETRTPVQRVWSRPIGVNLGRFGLPSKLPSRADVASFLGHVLSDASRTVQRGSRSSTETTRWRFIAHSRQRSRRDEVAWTPCAFGARIGGRRGMGQGVALRVRGDLHAPVGRGNQHVIDVGAVSPGSGTITGRYEGDYSCGQGRVAAARLSPRFQRRAEQNDSAGVPPRIGRWRSICTV